MRGIFFEARYLAFMKKLLLAFFLGSAIALSAQTKTDDLSSPQGLIDAFYSCLDVQKGGQIDSARFVNLFRKDAKLDGVVRSRKDTTKIVSFSITPAEYLGGMKGFTATHRFHEWSIGSQSLAYGHLMSVFSGYELIDVSPAGDTTVMRGVNTFFLYNDGKRWWITYCNYEEEELGGKLPAMYTRKDYDRKKD
jgi:hypothetical protein